MTATKRPDDQEFELVPHTRIRSAIGDRTLQSVNEIPQFRVYKQVIADELIAFRTALKQDGSKPLPTYNDILIKLVAATLPEFPRLNAWHCPEGLKLLKNVNVGFAAATDEGVLLPTVLDAGRKSLTEIAAETAEMIELARKGRLRASLQMGAGFTISNIGPVGVDAFDAIISPPQTGILAIGSITPSVVTVQDEVTVRRTMWLCLTMDHRSIDGTYGASFLAQLSARLGGPLGALRG